MTPRYGFSPDTWDRARAEMRAILVEYAKRRSMVPYSTLVGRMTSIRLEPDSNALAAMLGDISTEEHAAGRGMLSVIVVHKHGDMEPGHGFYELAQDLGNDTTDRVKFWVDELHRVHAVWSGARR